MSVEQLRHQNRSGACPQCWRAYPEPDQRLGMKHGSERLPGTRSLCPSEETIGFLTRLYTIEKQTPAL